MTRARRRAAAAALAVSALTVPIAISGTAHAALVTGDVGVVITMSDGVQLAAEVVTPASITTKHPLIVMPTSWSAKYAQYHNIAVALEQRGFIVVGYNPRGMGSSGGLADFAGPASISDASAVISWALANTAADPAKIGMIGMSYGAGISLLAAEHDFRIKAVGALSSWTDFDYSFNPNNAVAAAALTSLLGNNTVRLDSELTSLKTAVAASDPVPAGKLVDSLAMSRSPILGVSALNQNHTAVMLASGYQDSYFSPRQLVTFYNQLTGPKRLQLAVGDHTQPEEPAFFGSPNSGPFGDALNWVSHYLAGANNGINTTAPLQLENETTRATVGLAKWPTGPETLDLGTPLSTSSPQVDAGTMSTLWSTPIGAGVATAADAPPLLTNPLATFRFTTTNLTTLDPAHSDQWAGPTLTSPLTITGEPMVQLTVSDTSPRTGFALYLYDVNAAGTGTLIDAMPATVTGATTAKTVNLHFDPMNWTVPADDHLGLVIDTIDRRWALVNKAGSSLTVASTSSAPAYLSMPTN